MVSYLIVKELVFATIIIYAISKIKNSDNKQKKVTEYIKDKFKVDKFGFNIDEEATVPDYEE